MIRRLQRSGEIGSRFQKSVKLASFGSAWSHHASLPAYAGTVPGVRLPLARSSRATRLITRSSSRDDTETKSEAELAIVPAEPRGTDLEQNFPKWKDVQLLLFLGGAASLFTPFESWAAVPSVAVLQMEGLGGAFLDFLLHNPFITLGFSAAAVWVIPKLVKGVLRNILFPALALLLLFAVATHPWAAFHLGGSVLSYIQEHPVLSSITIIVFASLALTPYIMLLLGAVAVFFGATQLAQIRLPPLLNPFQSSPVVSQLSPLESGLVRLGTGRLQKAAPLLDAPSVSKQSSKDQVFIPEVLPPEVPMPSKLLNKFKGFGKDLLKATDSQLKGLAQSASDALTPEGFTSLQGVAAEKLQETQKVAAEKLEETQKAIKDPEAYRKFRMAARQATLDQIDNLSTTIVQTGERVIAPVNKDVQLLTETGQGVISAAQQSVDAVKSTALAVQQSVTSVDPTKAADIVQSTAGLVQNTVQDVTKVLSPETVSGTVTDTLESMTGTLHAAEQTAKGVVEAVSSGKVINEETTKAALQAAKQTAADTAQYVKTNVLTEENIAKAKEATVEGLKVSKDVAVKTWDFTSRFVSKFSQELKKLGDETAAK